MPTGQVRQKAAQPRVGSRHRFFIVRHPIQQLRAKKMTISVHDGAATTDAQETKKQRKKQARREAKLLLKLGQAKDDVQKAEQKVAKAQARLEACRTYLRDLEAKAQEMHAPQGEVLAEMSNANNGQPENATTSQTSAPFTAESSTDSSTPTSQVTSLPPAEGRADIPEDVPQEPSSPSAEAEPTSESSAPSLD
jgi:chromosome segregation ATPase